MSKPLSTAQLLQLRTQPRHFKGKVEVRAAEDGGPECIVGTASTFEDPENYDCYGTVFGPTCFDDAIEKHNSGERLIKVLWQHMWSSPMGLTTEISVDENGLHVTGAPIAEDPANAIRMAYIRSGVIDKLSIGFFNGETRYEVFEDILDDWGYPVWMWTLIPWREWSPVTFAANEGTSAMVRAALPELHKELREAPPLPGHLAELSMSLFARAAGLAEKGNRRAFDLIESHVLKQVIHNIRAALAFGETRDADDVVEADDAPIEADDAPEVADEAPSDEATQDDETDAALAAEEAELDAIEALEAEIDQLDHDAAALEAEES